jgi:predicted membrane protein
MTLIAFLVVVVIAALIIWAVNQFPIDPTLKTIVRVVVIIIVVLCALQLFGLLHGVGAFRLN